MKMQVRTIIVLLLTISFTLSVSAQTTEFTYQGSLTNSSNPASGNYDFEFALYDALSGGTQLGSTLTRSGVAVAGGVFSVKLDFGANFPGANRFMEIHVRTAGAGAYTTLTPRQTVNSAPYSVQSINATNAVNAATATTATNATQLNGQPAAFYQNVANLSSGTLADARLSSNVALLNTLQTFTAGKTFSAAPSFTAAGSPFSVTSTTLVTNLNADRLDGLDSPSFLQSVPNPLSLSGTSVSPIISGANTDGIGVFGSNSSTSGIGVYGRALSSTGTTYGVYGRSDSTYGTGVIGWADAASGQNYGVIGRSNGTSGRGVYGWATAVTGITYGGRFESNSTSGYGVYGQAAAGTGTTYGVVGQSDSTYGRGVYAWSSAATGTTYGLVSRSDSTGGFGLYSSATASSGVTYGAFATSSSANGYGVYGSGGAYGVYGLSNGTSAFGVFGRASSGTGPTYGGYFRSDSVDGTGLMSVASATTGGVSGIIGQTNDSSGYGVYAFGRLGASGSKPFRIDHPDDPENKYLLHFASESPEVINFYSGKVILNNEGEAVVELPAYFAKINKDPRYQLTAVGTPMPMLYVADEIDEAALSAGAKAGPGEAALRCTFRIAGGAPGGKVSWRVEAVRNDLWVRTNGAAVEVEKQGREKGTYQHPELYGQPKEKGMNYDATLERKEAERKALPEPPRRP